VYQWQRASTSTGAYSNIDSAVNNTYVLTDSDIGKYIKVSVVATNGAGSASVLSDATSVVVDLPDSVVPTATTPVSTTTGFTFTISNYSANYTYALTTTKGTVSRSTEDVTVTGLAAGEFATVTIAVTRTNYKPASKTVTSSAIPAPTTTTSTSTTSTTVAPALSIVIQAPVTTVAQGQASVATIAPTTTTLPVLGANGLPIPTTTTSTTVPVRIVATTTTFPAIVKNAAPTPPIVEKVSAGQTAVQVDGVKTAATVTRENNQMVVTAGSLSATLSGLDKGGKTSPLDSDGNIHLAAGDVIKISVGGFKTGSLVEVWLFSTPTKLGSAVVGADGAINGLFTIPAGIESGSHRVVISAKLPNGKPTTFTLGILVGKINKTSTLTRVLIAIPISLAIGFGFLLPTQLRRRRKIQSA
jgi:titin